MKRTLHNAIFTLTLGAMSTLSATHALANQADAIQVSDPYVREMPAGAFATASFMTLSNQSNQAIKLVKANSDVAKITELHTHTNDNGMMRMRQVPFFEVPANGQAELKPGGNHIMLISPTKTLKAGETATITLTFEDGSHKQIQAPVKSVMKMGGMDHSNHQHH